jgi:hypothetical protein
VRACVPVCGWMGCFVFILRLRFVKTPALSLSRARTRNGNNCHRQRSSQKEKAKLHRARLRKSPNNRQHKKRLLSLKSLAGRDKPTRLPRDTHTEKIQNKRRACTTTTPSFCLFYSCSKNPVPHRRKKKNIPIDRCSLSAFHQLLDGGGRRTEHEFLCVCVLKGRRRRTLGRVCVFLFFSFLVDDDTVGFSPAWI